MPPREYSGTDLRADRRRLGLTQAALAARLGVTPNTIARWERGEIQMARAAWVRRIVAGLRPVRRPVLS